jgi:hypothetical protein
MGSTFQRMSVAGNVLVPVFNSGLVCVPIVVITPDIDFYSGRLDLVITTITSKRIHYPQISSFSISSAATSIPELRNTCDTPMI